MKGQLVMQWQSIEKEPADKSPFMVLYYKAKLMLHTTDGTPCSPKIEPGRDEAFELGFWNGESFCFLGTGHEVFEWPDDHLNENKPTHWAPLPAPPTE